jgi:hypothetical protein
MGTSVVRIGVQPPLHFSVCPLNIVAVRLRSNCPGLVQNFFRELEAFSFQKALSLEDWYQCKNRRGARDGQHPLSSVRLNRPSRCALKLKTALGLYAT